MTDEFLKRFEERRKAREQADRTFELLGEKLTFRPQVSYEVGKRLEEARWEYTERLGELRDYERSLAAENGNATSDDLLDQVKRQLELKRAFYGASDALIEAADEQIALCLEPHSRATWASLRDLDSEHPLSADEIADIANYLLGRVVGIPTDAPIDSSGGRETTDSESKGGSSSKVKASKG